MLGLIALQSPPSVGSLPSNNSPSVNIWLRVTAVSLPRRNKEGAAELLRVMEEPYSELETLEAGPDPKDGGVADDEKQYIIDCDRLIKLGLKRWPGGAKGRRGPRVLDPAKPTDAAIIKSLFSPPLCTTNAIEDFLMA